MKKTRRDKQVARSEKRIATPAVQSFAADSRHPLKPDLIRSKGNSIFRKNGFWIAITLIALNVFVYAPVRHYGFVFLDDLSYVTDNPHLREPILQGIKWAFTTNRAAFWMPITWLSHMLDARLFGSATGPQHVTNVIFHAINSLLLFGLLCRLTDEWKPSAFVAALFAVHPLHVESVAWIAERKDVLSTFFWLLALLAYTGYVRKPGLQRYLMVLLFFGLGLMSKPTLVTLPFGLLLLDIWPLRRLRIERGQQRAWLRLTLEKLPMVAMTIASSVVTVMMSVDKGNIAISEKIPLSLRLANACVSYVAYIKRYVLADKPCSFLSDWTSINLASFRKHFVPACRICTNDLECSAAPISSGRLALVPGYAGPGNRAGSSRKPVESRSLYLYAARWSFYSGNLGTGFSHKPLEISANRSFNCGRNPCLWIRDRSAPSGPVLGKRSHPLATHT